MDIKENIPLSTLTTFKTGGPARFLISVYDEGDIVHALSFAQARKLPFVPLGDGSNLCAPDEGVSAVFVHPLMRDVSVTSGGEIRVAADAGLSWDALVERAVSEGWWGIENLSGIPGTVGASVVQNIGAYGAAISERVFSVMAFDTKTRAMRTFSPSACGFGYRTSIFKRECDRYLVTKVTLSLSREARPNILYRDLAKRFQGDPVPSLQDIRDAVIDIRKGKFPPLSEFGTAGSFFLNPIVSPEERSVLAVRYPEMPFFALPEGGVKVPLAWLFDRVLSLKGMRQGKAFVWHTQPLVIAAESGACSKDVYTLASRMALALREKTGIIVAPEVRLFVPFPHSGTVERDSYPSRV